MRIDNDERYKAKCLRALSYTLLAAVEQGYCLGEQFARGILDAEQVRYKTKTYVSSLIKELDK